MSKRILCGLGPLFTADFDPLTLDTINHCTCIFVELIVKPVFFILSEEGDAPFAFVRTLGLAQPDLMEAQRINNKKQKKWPSGVRILSKTEKFT